MSKTIAEVWKFVEEKSEHIGNIEYPSKNKARKDLMLNGFDVLKRKWWKWYKDENPPIKIEVYLNKCDEETPII